MDEKPKRILHIVGTMNMGGTETMLMNLYRNIDRNKIQFDFIQYTEKECFYDKEIQALGGKIIRLKSPTQYGFIKSVKELSKIIKVDGRYQAVHAHTLFNSGVAVLAAYLSGIKVRISHAHTTADKSNSILRKIYIFLMRRIIRLFSTKKLFCSKKAGAYLFGEISNRDYGTYLPNYIEFEKFINNNKRESTRNMLGIKENDIVIGHVGRFIPIKNHKFIIQVLEKLKDRSNIKLILVGDGDTRGQIETQVKNLGLEDKVIFLGIRNDIDDLINAMDVFIFPSIYEGLGLVLLEAQAGGIPCIVSEAIQPEVDLGIGLIKQIRLDEDTEIWAEEILKSIHKREFNKDKIEQVFRSNGFTIDNIVTKLMDIYTI